VVYASRRTRSNREPPAQGRSNDSSAPRSNHNNPASAPVPPYYPDTPGARRTMARVHDCITAVDKHAGQILDELARDGLADDTIVFFWPDHGQGIPRGKRTLWDTGLRVPLDTQQSIQLAQEALARK